jgi:hypothetical protein
MMKRGPGALTSQYVDTVGFDEAVLSRIEGTAAARTLWADAAATSAGLATGASIVTVTIGTGAACTGITLGAAGGGTLVTIPGDVTVGDTAEVTTSVTVAPGATPTILTAGKLERTGAADLEVKAPVGQDLDFTARGATTPLNEVGEVSLDGAFTAISIIGALNELVGGVTTSAANLRDTFTNGSGVILAVGDVVYVDPAGAQQVARADATNVGGAFAGNITKAIGVATAVIAIAAMGVIQFAGIHPVRFVAGLALTNGDTAYLGKTLGFATNNVSAYVVGDTIRELGPITDASTYTGVAGDPADVLLSIAGEVLVV